MVQRQIVLDTETTGLDPNTGHRVIEIGGIELINRRLTSQTFHYYLRPDREIDPQAQEIHGISAEFLADKPRFEEVVEEFLNFVEGAELVIHNAPFDVGFLNAELSRWNAAESLLEQRCGILDTLSIARSKHPGQRNSLDALCKRYNIDNSSRDLHGALLDAQILAQVYLAMTGGQTALMLDAASSTPDQSTQNEQQSPTPAIKRETLTLVVMQASAQERQQHEEYLSRLAQSSSASCLWSH